MKYLVTAAYADVVDEPQVYETTVEAESVEEAETIAQRQAIEDNGGTVGEDDETFALTDIFARPDPRAGAEAAWSTVADYIEGCDDLNDEQLAAMDTLHKHFNEGSNS